MQARGHDYRIVVTPKRNPAADTTPHATGREGAAAPGERGDNGARSRNAWWQLLRAPNLLTVPGDPLAGALLALSTGTAHAPIGRMACAAGAALCLYGFGLILNDLCDATEDARDRPMRPIPSGAISTAKARRAAWATALGGIGLAALTGSATAMAACLLLALIVLYDAGFKRIPLLGPATMGACRAASIWMGAVAVGGWHVPSPALMIALAGVGFYIASVTALAKHETRRTQLVLRRECPWLCWGTAAILLARGGSAVISPLAGAAITLSIWRPWRLARSLAPSPEPETLQAAIGVLIRALLPIQAALAAVSGHPAGLPIALVLLALWPLAAACSRRWHGS